VSAFLQIQWHEGKLVGNKSKEKFFGKCDKKSAMDGDMDQRNISIILQDEKRTSRFDIIWPVRPIKWTGSEFKTSVNEIAIETLKITHEGGVGRNTIRIQFTSLELELQCVMM
jgi:phage tail-like protein